MNEYRGEDPKRNFYREPDWVFQRETYRKNASQCWQQWFDFWSGRAALNFLETAHFVHSLPKKETGDFKPKE